MKIWQNTSISVGERADTLLAQMDTTEKIHQLGSYWEREEENDTLAAPESGSSDVAPMEHEFAQSRLPWEQVSAHGLGHLTRVFGSDPVSVQDGVSKLIRLQDEVRARSSFGIPAIVHEECLTGFTALGATVYPAAIAWGATWRPSLVQEMAAAIGQDMHAIGVHQGLSPLLDVVRDYRWGRVEETCGEDPYLVGTLGTAYVRGLQGAGVMATLKHFVAYPASRAGRNHAPVPMGPRELEDMMLPPFEMAVREGGVSCVMNSYSDIDGQPAASSHKLLTQILRQRWGFSGAVVSDYWSVKFLETMHRVASDEAHAAALALHAGLDVELPETGCYASLQEAVDKALVTEEELDTAVRRVLVQKIELGLLDPEWDPRLVADGSRDLDSAHNRDVARRMAEESVVLLSNDGVLPLSAERRLAVIGPSWSEPRSFMGCYSFPNHVLSRFEEHGTGLHIRTLREALTAITASTPTFVEGTGFLDGSDEDIERATAAAEQADIAVVTVGDIAGLFGGGTSGEGCDVVDLGLPGRQGELVDAVLGTGTPTILVLVTGRPYALGEYAGRCAAVVQAFMPGVEGADAIAGVLSGRVNPSGRLPIAIPDNRGGQPGTYLVPTLGWYSEGVSNLDPRPLYPFGDGMSYTTFSYTHPVVSSREVPVDGMLEYSVTITNTGTRAGSETVQLYMNDPWAEVVRPLKQLIGFEKVDLAAGESVRVSFVVHTDRFSFTGADLNRVVEPGEILLSAGHSSEDRLPWLAIQLVGERRVVAEGRVLTTPVHAQRTSGDPIGHDIGL